MKIALLSESSADEAAVSILIEGLLGRSIQRVRFPEPPTRGWRGVFKAIEPTLRNLHYCTQTEALVVTLDSDESPVHRKDQGESNKCDPDCRLCNLREKVESVQASIRPRQGLGPIRIVLGIAVPAIEAWCLCDKNRHISEATWIQALRSKRFTFTKKSLKQTLYGSTEPSLALETKELVKQARRLVKDDQLPRLESLFPIGFGSLAEEVRSWRS